MPGEEGGQGVHILYTGGWIENEDYLAVIILMHEMALKVKILLQTIGRQYTFLCFS